jgi:hypothetical protein
MSEISFHVVHMALSSSSDKVKECPLYMAH